MRRSLGLLVSVLAGMVWSASAGAHVPEPVPTQYEAIPERNVFGLKPPEQTRLEPKAPPLPRLILTGITTILGNKRALMKEVPVGSRPGDPSQERSLILTEGQREGDIEVLAVDEKAGTVKVNNSGTIMTLDFKKDGPQATSRPAPRIGSWGRPGFPMPATARGYRPAARTYTPPNLPSWRIPRFQSRGVRWHSSTSRPPPMSGGTRLG
jgi:hypothetical protein